MSIIRSLLKSLAFLALPVSCVLAQDKPPAETASQGVESLAAVKKEYRKARDAHLAEQRAAITAARKNGTEKLLKFDKEPPRVLFSRRFLAIAENNPEGPEAIDALTLALQTSSGVNPGEAIETRAKAIKILRDHFAKKPSIKGFLNLITSFDDADSKALVAFVLAQNPDRSIQAAVYKEQIANREEIGRYTDIFKDPKQLPSIEKARGKDFVKGELAKGEVARKELDELRKIVREKYGDLVIDLSIGSVAPEIKMQSLEGKVATLSALRGKVVVLDIWATWCGPCVKMIPHEREMVERLKDKPFALVSISADEKKETLTNFLAKEKMPWTHWWNGSEGGIIDRWEIEYFPTIYVIDRQGVIRHKDLRGAELEKAVNALLAAQVNPSK
jgi:thiol-disulfide isomerase/thioredoxin